MGKYVRRGNRVSVGQSVTQNDARNDNTNNVTVNTIVTPTHTVEVTRESAPVVEREITLDDIEDEAPAVPAPSELWTVSLLKMIINAINNAYFNAKFVDNIILLEDLKEILETVIRKRVEITLSEVEPCCSKCEKVALIRDIAKITVIDEKSQQNFKYAYNAIYESLLNDFHINMNRVYINPIV